MNWLSQGDLSQTGRDLGGSEGLFFAQDYGSEVLAPLQLLSSPFPTTPRKDPFLVRGGRRKVLVSATLENRKENAYNTSLSLSFSRNLHLASFTPQVPLGERPWEELGRLGYCPGPGGALERGSMFGGCRQESSCSPSLPHTHTLVCSQRDRPMKVECTAPLPHARLCSVGYPVFQAGAKVSWGPR